MESMEDRKKTKHYAQIGVAGKVIAYHDSEIENCVELSEVQFNEQISGNKVWFYHDGIFSFMDAVPVPVEDTPEDIEIRAMWKRIEETPDRADILDVDSMNNMIAVAEAYEKADSESLMLMLTAAESYEMMYNENMILMTAVAELYEEVQAMKGGAV